MGRELCLPSAAFEARTELFLCFNSECYGQLAEQCCRKCRLWGQHPAGLRHSRTDRPFYTVKNAHLRQNRSELLLSRF